ncbi:hypothetical protein BofuT4_P098160.1 [Botrytis cinerea T4]|uniref:Uncharacterized protein n=1 Tax=Botryotinia fuckeliana (strain T4) TaxID=999810 RepID=G2YCL1_BOTF4|nr:hypothetical protein BofuT4_P098160.1 [Botrytis cinerea T4]
MIKRSDYRNFNFLNSDIWTSIHAYIGVICVSLPTFITLYPKITYCIRNESSTPLWDATICHFSTKPYRFQRGSSSQEALLPSTPAAIVAGRAPAEQQPYELGPLDIDQIRVKRTAEVV